MAAALARVKTINKVFSHKAPLQPCPGAIEPIINSKIVITSIIQKTFHNVRRAFFP